MQRIKVFISSVQKEFSEERKLISNYIREDALLGKFFEPFLFEEMPAANTSAQEAYISEVGRSEIYLGIYGQRETKCKMSLKMSLKMSPKNNEC